jgi:hypothetical protein
LNSDELQESVQDAVREAVKGVILQAVEQQSATEWDGTGIVGEPLARGAWSVEFSSK